MTQDNERDPADGETPRPAPDTTSEDVASAEDEAAAPAPDSPTDAPEADVPPVTDEVPAPEAPPADTVSDTPVESVEAAVPPPGTDDIVGPVDDGPVDDGPVVAAPANDDAADAAPAPDAPEAVILPVAASAVAADAPPPEAPSAPPEPVRFIDPASEAAPDDGEADTDEEKPRTDWLAEIRGLLWLVLAVLVFHSFIAKPFYIPSESMMPALLVGDRLVVTKYPYGFSYVSPTFHVLPFIKGRLFGQMPKRGDIVILKPPQADEDYIKRVIGLPGDKLEVSNGVLILNDKPVKRGPLHYVTIPDYGGVPLAGGGISCDPATYGVESRVVGDDGKVGCRVPVIRETLPNGVSYDTIDLGFRPVADNYGPIRIPAGHVFLMGDNRDNSADSRFPAIQGGLGGPVPWEDLGGRAEFITFSFDGSGSWNPLTWWGALRSGRAGTSLHPQKDADAKP